MKVKELIKELKKSNPNDIVLIAVKSEGGPCKPGVGIVHLYHGFDWDTGKTYIVGNQDLVTNLEYQSQLVEIANPDMREMLPVLDSTRRWLKFHQEMGAEIVFNNLEDEEGNLRSRPIRAIYDSPLVNFQKINTNK